MSDDLIASLTAALSARPGDTILRLHLARLLLDADRHDDAVQQLSRVLVEQPANAEARSLLHEAFSATTEAAPAQADPPLREAVPAGVHDEADLPWTDAWEEMPLLGPASAVVHTGLTLADVGGLDDVKQRLRMSFLEPLRNPEFRKLYGKSLRGGLLLWGPPGCGKTFLARALAGELQASFLAVSLADVLDMYIGNSEKNVHLLFEQARQAAPCVLFLDEIDAIGQKRSMTRNNAMRGTVNQLLTELDGVQSENEGVYVLGATNSPWDVDEALVRPGRLDRKIFVTPPDAVAREHILAANLSDRPTERLDLRAITKATQGYSGADLAHLCETAAEFAMTDSIASGVARPIRGADLERARREVRSSLGPWLESSRNVVLYANQSGDYDDLARYLKQAK